MAKGEKPTVYITPAQPISYDHTSRTFFVDQDGLPITTRTLSQLKSGSISELNPHLNGHTESKIRITTGLVLDTQGTLIELPNLRKALTGDYNDRQRNRIARRVNATMLEVYRSFNPSALSTTKTFCAFEKTGVFQLAIDGVRLSANPDSHAVSIPLNPAPPTEKNPAIRPDIRTDPSLPIAYWHTAGSEAALISLLAGASKLASLALEHYQYSPAIRTAVEKLRNSGNFKMGFVVDTAEA